MRKKNILLIALSVCLGSLSADMVHPNGCKGPVLCTSNPIIDSCGFTVEVGLILEQMRLSNTDVAFYRNDNSGNGSSGNPTNFREIVNLNFNLEPGVRASVGYEFDHDYWTARADFEWLYSKASFKNTVDAGNYQPTHMPYLMDLTVAQEPLYQSINASLELDYFLLDVYLSRGSYLSGMFSYEPFAGIKAAWIDYTGARRFSNATSATNLSTSSSWLNKHSVDFWGVGPLIGMNGNYIVCEGWGLFSMTNFSVLFGEAHIKDYFGFVSNEDYPGDTLDRAHQLVLCPTLRTMIGLQYDQDMLYETGHVTLRAGFDGRYYFNQYPIINRVAKSKTAGLASDLRLTNGPETIENGSWGMLGLLLDIGYDF